jgi:hypothetical protein
LRLQTLPTPTHMPGFEAVAVHAEVLDVVGSGA